MFDAFYAMTAIPSLTDGAEASRMVQTAASALLDKIGPAILITHSQAGPFGWLIADSRPNAVKGIVAVEPTGAAAGNGVGLYRRIIVGVGCGLWRCRAGLLPRRPGPGFVRRVSRGCG